MHLSRQPEAGDGVLLDGGIFRELCKGLQGGPVPLRGILFGPVGLGAEEGIFDECRGEEAAVFTDCHGLRAAGANIKSEYNGHVPVSELLSPRAINA